MPIFHEGPVQPKPKPDTVAAWKPGLKTAVIDTRYTPQTDLLAYIEGSTWVVDYYSQVLDANNEVHGQDTSLAAPFQQYKRIWSMELKVTQDLTNVSQDPSTNEMLMQGGANVYPFLVPQVGDMFRAGISDGREGLFKVTTTNRRQISTDSVHVIEYQLIAINDPQRIYDLNEKTIATYYFIKDFLLNQQNPLLIEEDYQASRKLEVFWHDLIQLYFKSYFSREYMTLVVPGQSTIAYDHGLTDFVKTIMDSSEDAHIQSIRQLNIGDDGAIKANNIWTMLLRADPKLMKHIYTKTGLVSRLAFHRSAMMAGMRYTGIQHIVYPVDAKLNVDFEYGKELQKPIAAVNIVSKMEFVVPPVSPDPEAIVPSVLIKPLNFEEAYVLSSAFYSQDKAKCSLLERLVLEYLEFKLIAAKDILALCDDSYNWNHAERFYYIPLVLILIKYNLRRL